MNRDQQIKTAAAALYTAPFSDWDSAETLAEVVIDVLMPRVTTAAELEALPDGTVLVSDAGFPYWLTDGETLPREALVDVGPFTAVWQP